jgi:hypothetical protein
LVPIEIKFNIINDALLRTLYAYMYVLKCARIINLFPHWYENVYIDCIDFLLLIYGVLTPLSTIFQLYHGDQFVCQTNMHLIMWIENAFKFCGKLIHFCKERNSFLEKKMLLFYICIFFIMFSRFRITKNTCWILEDHFVVQGQCIFFSIWNWLVS